MILVQKFNANDVVTYKLNNDFPVSVTIGESITMVGMVMV